MNLSDAMIVFCKEWSDLVRDRRTLRYILFLPAVYIPLFFFVPSIVTNQLSSDSDTSVSRVCFFGPANSLKEIFARSKRIKIVEPVGEQSADDTVMKDVCDVAIVVPDDFKTVMEENRTTSIRLIDNAYSSHLLRQTTVMDLLAQFGAAERVKRIEPYGIPRSVLRFVKLTTKSVSSNEQRTADWFGIACSMFIANTIVLYAMSPALDLIAGERERGTLSVLLSSAADRQSIVVGKLAAVAALTFMCSIVSLGATCLGIICLARFAPHMIASWTISLPLIAIFFSTFFILLLSIGTAAGAILVSSFAKTFQQGQFYFLPIVLVGLAFSISLLVADENAPIWLYCTPMLNLVMCIHKCIRGELTAVPVMLSLVSSGLCIYVLIKASLKVFDDEDALFGIKHARNSVRNAVRQAFVLYGIAIAAFFYLSPLLQTLDFLWGLVLAQVVTLAIPAIASVKFIGLPVKQTLRLFAPRPLALLGALMLLPFMIVASSSIASWQSSLMPGSEEYLKSLMEFILPKGANIVVSYIAIAITPAICEELLFRGVIQSLLRNRLSKPTLVIVVGAMFGVMHMSLARLLPTAVMGTVLSIVAEMTGSIFPCMIMHACNNAVGVWMHDRDVRFDDWLIAPALLSTAVGVWLLLREKKKFDPMHYI